jgi:hypothetical protein
MMKAQLRLPAVLAVAVLSAAGAVLAVTSCGSEEPEPDAMGTCGTYCIDEGGGSGSQNCPFPTCADVNGACPADCTPVG